MPADSYMTHENVDFEIILKRRLLLPIYNCKNGETLVCPKCKITTESGCIDKSGVPKLDLFGNHSTCCSSASGGPRKELWHDALVSMWQHLARFAGYTVHHEVSGIVVAQPQLRAYLYLPQARIILDQRTAVTCDKSLCAKAATTPGAAAEAGTVKKESKWKTSVDAQGDSFKAVVCEEGGTFSGPSLDLVAQFSRRAGESGIDPAAFKTYALQRLHAVCQVGVVRLCRTVQPIPLGPRQISISVLRFGVPTRRPLGSALASISNLSAPRPQWHAIACHCLNTTATATAPLPALPPSPPLAQNLSPLTTSPRLPIAPALALIPFGSFHDPAA
jgi:hypothetical protein